MQSQRLENDGLLSGLMHAMVRGETEYSVADLGVPGLRHFVYKSRPHVQVTMPLFEDPYDEPNEKRRSVPVCYCMATSLIRSCMTRRLTILYQTLYDAIHAKSGQESTLKLQYIRTEWEAVMGWVRPQRALRFRLSH